MDKAVAYVLAIAEKKVLLRLPSPSTSPSPP